MDADIEFVERKISSERQVRAFAMRKSRAQIERQMTGPMQDAEFEIERAFNILAKNMGYATLDPLHVKGTSEPDAEWQQAQIRKYHEWSRLCPRLERAIVIDFVLGTTAKDVAYQRAMDQRLVVGYFLRGLNEYCKLQGWGEQINEVS